MFMIFRAFQFIPSGHFAHAKHHSDRGLRHEKTIPAWAIHLPARQEMAFDIRLEQTLGACVEVDYGPGAWQVCGMETPDPCGIESYGHLTSVWKPSNKLPSKLGLPSHISLNAARLSACRSPTTTR